MDRSRGRKSIWSGPTSSRRLWPPYCRTSRSRSAITGKPGSAAIEELTDIEKIDEGGLDLPFRRDHDARRASARPRPLQRHDPRRQRRWAEQAIARRLLVLRSRFQSHFVFVARRHQLSARQGRQDDGPSQRPVRAHAAGQHANGRPGRRRAAPAALEPNADNTLLLYDNPELGIRFLYPRRWHVGSDPRSADYARMNRPATE